MNTATLERVDLKPLPTRDEHSEVLVKANATLEYNASRFTQAGGSSYHPTTQI